MDAQPSAAEKLAHISAQIQAIAAETDAAIFCCFALDGKIERVAVFPSWSLLQRNGAGYRLDVNSKRDDQKTLADTLQLLLEFRNLIGSEYSTLDNVVREICVDLGIDYTEFLEDDSN